MCFMTKLAKMMPAPFAGQGHTLRMYWLLSKPDFNVYCEMKPDTIIERIRFMLEPLGFECHPFKIGWYNEQVQSAFHLQYDPDTLAAIILSTPSMFEKTLKPFILRKSCPDLKDPIDQCMQETLHAVKESLPDIKTDILLDYQLDHCRRPQILVQTAGHVSGAARYYQRSDIENDPWRPGKKIFGVSIHPLYGGWFAFRGVLVFTNVQAPDLPKPTIPDPVPTDEGRIELLRRFNECWTDWTFRDIIPVTERYSEEEKLYFATPPQERKYLIEDLLKNTFPGHD